jgi:hypothetical protein
MWANSANAAGHRHALVDHLYGTARLAQEFAEPFGGGDAAFLAGLAHGDLEQQLRTRLGLGEREGREP